ncbi:AAA family ATPase [Phenylobacterium sp.]|uniref:AAA family ATPase n=1 Tax=Phenylobacterium sp. TaxID=1871053 RepID=UPI00286CFF83|nr:AAA family ATPase [Phenylobacterium sp.]
MSSQPTPAGGLAGRRVLALGKGLSALADGPFAGAHLEIGGLERLSALGFADAELIVIDADAWEPQTLELIVKALAACPAPPPALLVGAHLPTAVVRGLLRLERSDVLDAPYTDDDIASAIAALMVDTTPVSAPADGAVARCWAITGAVGGAGATTVAIEIANALCTRQAPAKDRSVCLIDLNLADGAAAAYLGANPTMKLAEFSQSAERIDAAMLQAFVTPVSKQLDLLAAIRDPSAFDTVSREAVLRVLEVACESYEWVIIDMPRHRRAWTLEALGGCDEVLVVSELTVPALIAARALSDEIDRAPGSDRKPRIVLNRLAGRMFGPAPSMSEAEKALQRKAEAGISSDWEAAAASVNLGGPIATHRPKSKIVKDVHALVERLAAEPVRRVVQPQKAA